MVLKAVLDVLKFFAWLAISGIIIIMIMIHMVIAFIDVPAHFLARWLAPVDIFNQWSWNHLLSWSQKFNVWHMGDPDETFSSRVGKAMQRVRPSLYFRIYNWFLNWFEDDHARKAVEKDEGKDQILRNP